MNDEVFDCKVPDITPAKGNGLVYIYTLDNGKQYVGMTTQSMKNRHLRHMGGKVQKVDHDLKNHKWHLMIIGEYSIDNAEKWEINYMRIFNTGVPNGYNTRNIGTNFLIGEDPTKVFVKINTNIGLIEIIKHIDNTVGFYLSGTDKCLMKMTLDDATIMAKWIGRRW